MQCSIMVKSMDSGVRIFRKLGKVLFLFFLAFSVLQLSHPEMEQNSRTFLLGLL